MKTNLLELEPVPTLLRRVRAELGAAFDAAKPIRVSRAPGRLDVMGGIADYTGSLVCEATLHHAAAVALQERPDRQVQVFSFNLFDEHRPFTFGMTLDDLASASLEALHKGFSEPGRRWAGYLVGCLYVLHQHGYIDLKNPNAKGMNLALHSTVPLGAGVSSSAAIEVATMMALVDHFEIPRVEPSSSTPAPQAHSMDAMRLAALCQEVENRVVGAPCGIMDQVTSCYGQAGSLLRMVCQPHDIQPPLAVPSGIQLLGINTNVKHSVGGGMYGRTRCAAYMGHQIILDRMAIMGRESGHELTGDPMRGYLANLDLDDYRAFFREHLPEEMRGLEFLEKYGPTIDTATVVDPDQTYHVLSATDHHVFEARRVRNFVQFMEEANATPAGTKQRSTLLDKAGHLMYASDVSYREDAKLGADEVDVLVDLVRRNEKAGLYGAKITGGGSGGTVAILANQGEKVDATIALIMSEYEKQTGIKPESITGTSPGAWHVGTQVVRETNA